MVLDGLIKVLGILGSDTGVVVSPHNPYVIVLVLCCPHVQYLVWDIKQLYVASPQSLFAPKLHCFPVTRSVLNCVYLIMDHLDVLPYLSPLGRGESSLGFILLFLFEDLMEVLFASCLYFANHLLSCIQFCFTWLVSLQLQGFPC